MHEQPGGLHDEPRRYCPAVITDDGPTPKFKDEEKKRQWEREREQRKLRERFEVAGEDLLSSSVYGSTRRSIFVDEDECKGALRFPISVLRKGLEIVVETAEASMEIDRVRILNSLSGQPNLDSTPPTSHVKFAEVTDCIV